MFGTALFGGDQVFRQRADRIEPRPVGRVQQVLQCRQHELSELRLADGRETAVRAEALHEPLDGRVRQDLRHLGAPGPLRVERDERAPLALGERHVGVVDERGEVVGRRAQAHALEVDEREAPVLPEDVRGLEVAVDERLRLLLQDRRDVAELRAHRRRQLAPEARAEAVLCEEVALPRPCRAVERRQEIGQVGRRAKRVERGERLDDLHVLLQRHLLLDARMREDERLEGRVVEQDLRHGHALRLQPARVPRVLPVLLTAAVVVEDRDAPVAAEEDAVAAARAEEGEILCARRLELRDVRKGVVVAGAVQVDVALNRPRVFP